MGSMRAALALLICVSATAQMPRLQLSEEYLLQAGEGLISDRQSKFSGRIVVMDRLEDGRRQREMLFDSEPNIVQSRIRCLPQSSKLDGACHPDWSFMSGSKVSEMASLAAAEGVDPSRLKMLIVGLGGGVFPGYIRAHMPDVSIEVIEIDDAVVSAARDSFGFLQDDHIKVHVGEAFKFVTELNTNSTYDIVIEDALVTKLYSKEFSQGVARILKPNGAYVLNCVGAFPKDDLMAAGFKQLSALKPPGYSNTVWISKLVPNSLSKNSWAKRGGSISHVFNLTVDLNQVVKEQLIELYPNPEKVKVDLEAMNAVVKPLHEDPAQSQQQLVQMEANSNLIPDMDEDMRAQIDRSLHDAPTPKMDQWMHSASPLQLAQTHTDTLKADDYDDAAAANVPFK